MSGQKKTGALNRPKGDLFALGNKQSRQSNSPSPALPPAKKPHLEEQDEGTSSGSNVLFSDPIKIAQSKVGAASESTSKLATTSVSGPQPIEVRSVELVSAIEECVDKNPSKVERILAGAFKQLKTARLKLDAKLNEALKTLVLKYPKIFSTPSCIENILTVLKKETSAIFKTRSEPLTYTLACNILLISLQDSYEWPENIAKIYIEDALGDRVWVDLIGCQSFTANVCTVFNTLTKPNDDVVAINESDALYPMLSNIEVQPRFSLNVCRVVHNHVMIQMRETLGKRGIQPSDVLLRNHIKFLNSACGISDVRLFITEKFEQWILNAKMVKPVQDLLCQVAYNCNQHTVDDIKTLENVVSAKLKTRLFSQQYVLCVKEFITSHPNNLDTIVKRLMINELGQTTRSPTNMQLLSMAIHERPDKAASILSAMFQEFLVRKEDYHRALRGFLRELVRQVRSENFPFVSFARGLMQDMESINTNKLDQVMKERLASCLTDLICLTCMMSASLLIREAHLAYTKGDKAMVAELRTFFETISLIQRDAVWWIHSVLPNTLRPQPTEYKAILRKVLFLESIEAYCVKDNWPGETERTIIFQLMTEAGLHGDTLMRLLVIGLMRELPLPPSDALDMADKLVARAANAHTSDIPRVPLLDRKELFNAVFDITAYCPPSSIVLPKNYSPPKLAISKLYWKGWILLLVLSAFNPTTIGAIGWEDYPTLKLMMEMVMTQNYAPPTDINPIDDIKGEILTYENHLASSSSSTKVTEANSYLLNHVTLLEPNGPPRRMLPSVVDLVKTVNASLRLGQLLCQCREPDFLLDIINHQGTNKAMNWLKELVDGSQSSLDVLPVSCLCEFLIMGYQERNNSNDTVATDDTAGPSHRSQFKRKHRVKEKLVQQQELIMSRLRTLLKGSSSTACLDVLNYFLTKLSSSQQTTRQLSFKSLQDVLGTSNWLLEGIPSLPTFNETVSQLVVLVLDACAIETDPTLLVKYISFLSHHLPDNQLISMVTLLSSIICKRYQFLQNILTDTSTLLSQFTRAFDMLVNGTSSPPDHLNLEDLRILCLPAGKDDSSVKEIIIQWDFLNALWLLLSLYSTNDERHLVNRLLPRSNPVKVVAMTTREPQPVLRDKTLQFILCGGNSALVESIVGVASLQSLVHYIGSYGVPIANMNIILDEIIKRGFTPSGLLIEHVKSHYLRGCSSAGLLLQQWDIAFDEASENLKAMVTLPKPLRQRPSCYVPEQTLFTMSPDFTKVLSDPSVTAEVIMFLLSNYDDTQKCMQAINIILQLLKTPTDRKTLMKQLESNEFSCLLLSLLKRSLPNIATNNTLLSIGDVIRRSSQVLLTVIKNLTKTFHDRPHEAIQQAIHVLKTDSTCNILQSPIKCDLIEILDPELTQLISTGTHSSLLHTHILQKSIHQTTHKSVCELIKKVLQLETQNPEDSSLILNYLWACLYNPKLWQGKVKNRNIALGLELSVPQLRSIAYHLNQDNCFLNISLLTRSCDIKRMREITSHLSDLTSNRDLLMQLYHSVPSIVDLIPINALKPYSLLSIPSEIDSPLHYIIHSMIDNTSNLKRLNGSSMLCRHIAMKHPLLMMRHLSLIGSLLKGKLSISPKQFAKNNLYLIFSNCFHILELLQPMVFYIPFEEVCTVLDPYIEFLKVDGAESTISPSLLLKLLSLLNHYSHHNREDGIKYITRHKSSLSSFAEIFYKQQSIINSLLTLLDSKQLLLSTTTTSTNEGTVHSYEKVLPFLKKLKHGSSEESMLEVLEDLDDSSTRSLDILQYFIPELCRIIQSGDYSHAILKLCHDLLVRYLRHCPQALEQVLPHIVTCLKSHDRMVVMATISSVPDIVALSSGSDAQMLLSILFNLSITLSHDYVTQSLSILIGHMTVYHEWMGSPELRAQTASERLTLAKEYQMQRDWMMQDDKATFIVLSKEIYKQVNSNETDAMIGDINIFFTDPNDPSVAEIEIMIAESHSRGKGHGYEACALMMYYGVTELGVKTFVAKIGKDNIPSRNLFEKKLQFHQVSCSDIFKEVTLQFQPSNDFIKNTEKNNLKWISYDQLEQEIKQN